MKEKLPKQAPQQLEASSSKEVGLLVSELGFSLAALKVSPPEISLNEFIDDDDGAELRKRRVVNKQTPSGNQTAAAAAIHLNYRYT